MIAALFPHGWAACVGAGLVIGPGAALLVGGCTSGHGICGIGSLKAPSAAAVAVFMATGFATALPLSKVGA